MYWIHLSSRGRLVTSLVQGTDGNGKARVFARALEFTACIRYCRFGLVEDRVCAMCRVIGGVSNRAEERGG